MPKQTFITKDFFVPSSEKVIRQKLFALPDYIPHIKFLKENSIVQSIRFVYLHPDLEKEKVIDVSIHSLNDGQSKITLHCSYADGSVFQKNPFIKNAIDNFESAIKASINNTLDNFEVCTIRQKPFQKFFSYFSI